MTHQQALNLLINIRHELGQLIDRGMEQKLVDMQSTLHREIHFDLLNFQEAWLKLSEHATEPNTTGLFPKEH